MTERQIPYGPDLMFSELNDVKPIQNWEDLLLTSRELAEGVFDIMTNEDSGMYLAWEKMTPEQEKRVKTLVAEFLEQQILERF